MQNTRSSWWALIATVGGLGHFSRMPGTLGTLAAMILFLITRFDHWALIFAIIVIGTVASDVYSKVTGKKDPGEVIIDEVAGFYVSVYGLDPSFAIIAFFLFRLIDITKPFPVGLMERLPGGVGIMADDVVGGLLVNILMRVSYWIFFQGGLIEIEQLLGIGA